ncbi:hypothetical protein RR45_GL000041 [Lactococcus chungangensis CAU 28 = DSM 22330]|uniref:Uncharacterized protein n=1 Tax=Pseudolactococcus chungangensis CAU 28 = DSM 22330 TaxID=1122154 RepID=A0ABX4I9H2_9LACT|nr:hypothetical protein RR45_GL000041 [Lactococcus chungangensis CAU 28 = DSM 22330]
MFQSIFYLIRKVVNLLIGILLVALVSLLSWFKFGKKFAKNMK